MKLERLEPSPRDASRLRLHFDSGETLTAPATVAADLGLYAGQELDEEAAAELFAQVRRANARTRAVRIVSAVPVSQKELESRLIRKGETPEDAAEAAQWLTELGAVDDRDMALRIVRQAAAKGYGPSRIRQILYQKRVPRELWDEALETLPEPDDAIDRFLAQRLRGQWPDAKTLKKTTDALCRRGHSWEDIRSGLERYRETLTCAPQETEGSPL